jgi:RNA polymerase sigma factor (sigma-70 family)
MPDSFLPEFLRSLRRAIGQGEQANLTDADLLRRFLDLKDPAAFEILVWRHAALVLGVCRRVLRRQADVDDAFQATFLVFLRRAGSIRRHETLAGWLYRVTYRVALRALRTEARRSAHEQQTPPRPAVEVPTADIDDELRPALDEELNRLPEKYRTPLVLHYLQGHNKEETAQLLRCPVGTVSSRLQRGRDQLRRRLVRRGVTLTGAGLGVLLAPEPAAALGASEPIRSLLQAALAVAAGRSWQVACLSQPSVALAQHFLKQMVMGRLARLAAVALLILAAIGTGSAAVLRGSAPVEPPDAMAATDPPRTDESRTAVIDPFANPPGYVWAVRPQGAGRPELTNQRDVKGTIDTGPDGALMVTVSHPPRYSRAGRPYYRPVAFDATGRRFLFSLVEGRVAKDRQAVNRYKLPPQVLSADRVKHVGVEELPPEGRKVAALHAAQLARARGLEPLPLPEPGQPFEFALTAEDGRRINSRDLLNRVAVIQCWAYWHQPSLEQRNKLKDLYHRRHNDGLEVVGIDLNNPGDKATGGRWWLSSPGKGWHIVDDEGTKDKAATVGPFPWANVRVPRELAERELWELSSEIFALPRVLILDRRGVLRADTPNDLETVITPLLRQP